MSSTTDPYDRARMQVRDPDLDTEVISLLHDADSTPSTPVAEMLVDTSAPPAPVAEVLVDTSAPPAPMAGVLVATETPNARPSLTVSVVIPTLNEAENIAAVLAQLERFDDIILVDGCSTDATVEIARAVRPDLRVLVREPAGKGDALRAGFAAATGDVIVIMDADGSMDPAEIDVFMSMIAVGFDLVKGSRLACGGGSHDLTRIRGYGNAALCTLANTLFRTQWTDLCYGFLAFRRSCLPQLALQADGFEIESQILAHAALAGLRIAEVPSIEMPRLAGRSHLVARRDGTRILRTMLTARFAPRARRTAAALRRSPRAGVDARRLP
jgi:Glycosyl transferase family 2